MTADVLGRDFTQAGNSALRDRRLSRRARGLLAELLSHCDGFGISIQSLVAAGPEGRDAIRAALTELEEHGYLVRKRERREDGTLGGTQYYITDMPDPVEQQNGRSEPATEKPTLDEPTQAEPTLADRLHKKTIPLQEDQLEEHHLSLPAVPKQRATGEREMDAAPNTTTTTTPAAAAAALPGVDAYTAQLADAAATARVPAPRATGTDSQQQEQHGPQAASRPPAATGASPAAQRIVDAYTTVLGRPLLSGTRTKLHDQAAEALAAGYPEAWLTDRARELAAHGWTDLAKHVEKSTAPLPGTTPPAAASSGRPPWCGECGGGHGAAAQFNMRFRRRDDGTLCHCHPDVALPRPSTTDQRVQAALDLGRQMQAEHDAAQARPAGTPGGQLPHNPNDAWTHWWLEMEAQAAAGGRPDGWEQYPHCGHPDCDEITRYRETDNGNGRSPVPCSGCHPLMQF